MGSYATTLMLILLSVSFMVYVGSQQADGTHKYSSSFVSYMEASSNSSTDYYEGILNAAFSNSTGSLIGGVAVGGALLLSGAGVPIALASFMFTFFANQILFPVSIFREVGLPSLATGGLPVAELFIVLFNLIIMAAGLSYIRGKDV